MGVRVHGNTIILTPDQEKTIRENFLTMKGPELAALVGLKITHMRHYAYGMGLKKMELEYWTEQQVEFVEFVYREIGDSEIAEYMQQHMPKVKPWSKKHICKKRRYLGLLRTKAELAQIKRRNVLMGCFAECPVKAWQKRGVTPLGERLVWTSAKKKPFGVIKTAHGFQHYKPWLWKQHYGEVPEGMVVYAPPEAGCFPDIGELSLITKADIMAITSQSDITIAKRFLGADTDEDVQFLVDNYPELIELRRNQAKLNGKLRSLRKKPGKSE